MKLEKRVLDRRVALLKDEGVTFITNTEVGKHVPARSLLDDYDALLLTVGATWPRGLNIPGSNAQGQYTYPQHPTTCWHPPTVCSSSHDTGSHSLCPPLEKKNVCGSVIFIYWLISCYSVNQLIAS